MAMKIEEVDLVSLRDILNCQDRMPPEMFIPQVKEMERKIATALNFKLMPDTLLFWFELVTKLWDIYLTVDKPGHALRPFKP